jgi:four helix bundle protein
VRPCRIFGGSWFGGGRTHSLSIRRTVRGFPRTDYDSLRTQMIRAADSIAANIVEGCGASTRREFARFLEISIKSAIELEYHLQLGYDCDVIPPRRGASYPPRLLKFAGCFTACGREFWRLISARTQQPDSRRRMNNSCTLRLAHTLNRTGSLTQRCAFTNEFKDARLRLRTVSDYLLPTPRLDPLAT